MTVVRTLHRRLDRLDGGGFRRRELAALSDDELMRQLADEVLRLSAAGQMKAPPVIESGEFLNLPRADQFEVCKQLETEF
jgi:hypothetical protein